MSNVKLLDFGVAPDFGNLGFSDLARNLEQRLATVKTLPDLEKLIMMLNPLLKAVRFSEKEHIILRRIRQRAYDKKRRTFAIARSKSDPNLAFEFAKSFKRAAPNKGGNMETVAKLPMPKSQAEKPMQGFSNNMQEDIGKIYSEMFINTAPKLALWFCAAAAVSFFLWQQSLALYQSAGFANPLYSAVGGILMIIGFAAYHSITRSWLALFLCVYAFGYEGYLMVSGTFHDDKQISAAAVRDDPEFIFLQETAEKEQTKYQELKQRHDNPESKVFKNEWFSKNHLMPAWQAYSKAQEELIAKRAAFITASNNENLTWLKIFYRLGLVFLCMVCVHQFFHVFSLTKANFLRS
jgi:hypothetical protein